jgi:hypothetical protein
MRELYTLTVVSKGKQEAIQISFMTSTKTYFIIGKHFNPSTAEVKQNTQNFNHEMLVNLSMSYTIYSISEILLCL